MCWYTHFGPYVVYIWNGWSIYRERKIKDKIGLYEGWLSHVFFNCWSITLLSILMDAGMYVCVIGNNFQDIVAVLFLGGMALTVCYLHLYR